MKKLYTRNTYNWPEITNTDLSLELARIKAPNISDSLELARIKAPNISDSNAANQVATALHEAIHLIYAVGFGIYVNFVAVSTRKKGSIFWKGQRSQGFTLAYDYNEGKPAIYSTCAAAIFELELNDKNSNELVQAELEIAYNAAKYLRWQCPYEHEATEFILENVLNNLTGHEFNSESGPLGRFWWLIRAVAIAILVSRTSAKGIVSYKNTSAICSYVRKYCKPDESGSGLGDYSPMLIRNASMNKDIKWLKNLHK